AFFIFPKARVYPLSDYIEGNAWFTDIARYIQTSLPWHDSPERWYSLIGFIAFAYTYHYLNWFIKVRIIGWHRAAGKRLPLLLVIDACSVLAYALDYRLGLMLLLFLSFLHVLLEFPLNLRTFGFIGRRLLARQPDRL